MPRSLRLVHFEGDAQMARGGCWVCCLRFWPVAFQAVCVVACCGRAVGTSRGDVQMTRGDLSLVCVVYLGCWLSTATNTGLCWSMSRSVCCVTIRRTAWVGARSDMLFEAPAVRRQFAELCSGRLVCDAKCGIKTDQAGFSSGLAGGCVVVFQGMWVWAVVGHTIGRCNVGSADQGVASGSHCVAF